MYEQIFKIRSSKGIHLNPATKIVHFAHSYPELKMKIRKGDVEISANSVMSILSLELSDKSEVVVTMSKKSEEAISFLEKIFITDD